MSKTSQLNQMSKKQILDSLLYQQQQSTATINRLLVALAQATKTSVADLAEFFVDSQEGQKYADELNNAIEAAMAKRREKQGEKTEDNTTAE